VPLLERIERVRPNVRMEVLFVDDSTDDTPCVISAQAGRSSYEVSLIHRRENEQIGGLGGAVQIGLIAARADLICVMDADLQHPPELLGDLFDEAARSSADLVVASRYCSRGDVGELSAFRLVLSRGAATVAKLLFPRRLRRISDPMSGFFLIRRSAIDVTALHPNGFKILLEVLLAGRRLSVSEVPFRFAERHAGASKASLGEGVRYIRRLLEMRVDAGMLGLRDCSLVGLRAW
jgi:dolichol-phosphate mannosyltransferase